MVSGIWRDYAAGYQAYLEGKPLKRNALYQFRKGWNTAKKDFPLGYTPRRTARVHAPG